MEVKIKFQISSQVKEKNFIETGIVLQSIQTVEVLTNREQRELLLKYQGEASTSYKCNSNFYATTMNPDEVLSEYLNWCRDQEVKELEEAKKRSENQKRLQAEQKQREEELNAEKERYKKEYSELQAWAKNFGSTLLQKRIENGFNWKKRALIEMICQMVPAKFMQEYDATTMFDFREMGNPSEPLIDWYVDVKKNLPTGAIAYLCVYDLVEDGYDTSIVKVLNIEMQVGSTKVDLLFEIPEQ